MDTLTDKQRFPLMDPSGRKMLRFLREHPHAPIYNHVCGNRLTKAGLEEVIRFAELLAVNPPRWSLSQPPDWVGSYVSHCYSKVPFYRKQGPKPHDFKDIPTCSREDLALHPTHFVPDDQPLDDLILYGTSGTTGHPLVILSHPITASQYLPIIEKALSLYSSGLEGGPTKVAIMQVCYQDFTYTFPVINPFLGNAGACKINLNPKDWRQVDDPKEFLDSCNPEIYTGDPISLQKLSELPLQSRPKAIVSTATTLTRINRKELIDHFKCPIIDLYSLNEAGPVGVMLPDQSGYELLQPNLYVEILDKDGNLCPPGIRGEITLTGGFNPFIPLLRYRTGDYASMVFKGSTPMLIDLEGREPVMFLTSDGLEINSIDVTVALRPLSIYQFSLNQTKTNELQLIYRGPAEENQVRNAILAIFGEKQSLIINRLKSLEPEVVKVRQYFRAVET